MTDPFDVLRLPPTPADPDPAFAARLRARLERALALPRGVTVTSTESIDPVATTATAEPTAAPIAGAAVPYLAVPAGAGRRALDWYVEVFHARRRGEPVVMPDGTVGHAELELGAGVLYLAEEFPDLGVVAPRRGEAPVSLVLTVPDVDDTVARATRAGADVIRPLAEAYGTRNATVVDPFGHRWMLQTPLAALPAGDRPGDD